MTADKTDMINVLVIEPEKKPYVKAISSELESLQHEVGGYIEAIYPYEDPVALVCDEEGKLTGKDLNRALRDKDGDIYDIVAGTFLIVGLGDEDFASLSDEFIEKYSHEFETPEAFFYENGKITVFPLKPSLSDMILEANKRRPDSGFCNDENEKIQEADHDF